MSVTIQAVTDVETAVDGYRIEEVTTESPAWGNFTPPERVKAPETRSNAAPRVLDRGNETDFDPEEASSHNQRRMRRQRTHNRDNYQEYRADVDMSSDVDTDTRIHLVRALGSQLEMSKLTVYRATRWMFSVDSQREGLPSGILAFCIYVHLHDKETEEYEERTQRMYNKKSPGKGTPYWPTREKEDNRGQFQRVADSLLESHRNVTKSGIQSLLQRLQSGGLYQQESASVPTYREIFSG